MAIGMMSEAEQAEAHKALAGLHLQSARYAEARRHLIAAIRLAPDSNTIRRLAQAWEDDPYGDDLRAAKAYRHAALLDANDAIAWAGLGRAAVRVNCDRLARRAIRRAVRLAPADERVLTIALDALREQGRLAEALRIANRAVFLAPHSSAVRNLVDWIRYEIARARHPSNPNRGSTGPSLLPFVRIVGCNGERRVVRRDEPSRPAPALIRMYR